MQEEVTRVRVAGAEVDLLGTAHVSKTSRDNVIERIQSGDYDKVMIELCGRRYQSLINDDALQGVDLWQLIKRKQATAVLLTLILQSYQQRIAEQLGIDAGAEMKAAIEQCKERNVGLATIDRDIGITMKRLLRKLKWWERGSLLSSLGVSLISRIEISEEEIEELKNHQAINGLFEGVGLGGKKIHQVLVDERDQYMAGRIVQEAQEKGFRRALVVIGKGHLAGIKRYLESCQPGLPARLPRLDELPVRSRFWHYFPWLVVAVILGGFFFGFSQSSELGWNLVMVWIGFNGGLSALGTFIAGGHLWTILIAFLAAPLTSLNPTIGAGMVTAFVELSIRKPKVKDFAELRQAINHWSGWRKNNVARILLIFFLSSLGSAIGTYWGGFYIYQSIL